jgi:hypothetical protein
LIAGKFLIGLYIDRGNVGGAYGPADAIIVLLTWLCYSSVIVLRGPNSRVAWRSARQADPAECARWRSGQSWSRRRLPPERQSMTRLVRVSDIDPLCQSDIRSGTSRHRDSFDTHGPRHVAVDPVSDGSASGLNGRWQAYCFAYGMSDHAYDISHLLDFDTMKVEPAELRIVRTPPPQQAAPSAPKPTSVVEAQEALARELMGVAAIHEALIHQYLSFAK